MNKIPIIILIILISTMLSGCRSVSREEAIKITQEFVNTQVKFYVNEENGTPTLPKANIQVARVERVKDIWYVYLHIESNQTGELKKKDLMVPVDAKKGEVITNAMGKS